ncbi:MAG: hypothetical protein GVY07_15735 [Bacteroidetes bacterium]|jgi:hypothetical protein|nr:hypothetical protein [Bacteroidota bacterium]
MDLMELKSAWNLLQQDVISNDTVEEKKIKTSVHSKSKSEIAKIKRALHIKFIIATVSIVFAAALAFLSVINPALNPLDFIFSPIETAAFLGLMALSLASMVFLNLRAYSKIEAIESSALNLKENLQHFIDAMQTAIAFNIYSDVIISPIIFTWAYYAYAFRDQSLDFDGRTVLLFMLPILFGVFSYLLGKFIQNLKFGKYLDRLSSYLDSLQKK